MMVRVPEDSAETPGRCAAPQLAAKLKSTNSRTTLRCRAGTAKRNYNRNNNHHDYNGNNDNHNHHDYNGSNDNHNYNGNNDNNNYNGNNDNNNYNRNNNHYNYDYRNNDNNINYISQRIACQRNCWKNFCNRYYNPGILRGPLRSNRQRISLQGW